MDENLKEFKEFWVEILEDNLLKNHIGTLRFFWARN